MQYYLDLSRIEQSYFKEKIERYCKKLFDSNRLKVIGITLFGSVARMKARNDDEHLSDVDLIVVLEGINEDYFKRIGEKVEIEGLEGAGIEAIWLTQNELLTQARRKVPLLLDAFKDGIPIYDPTNLLVNTRRELMKDLKRKGVREGEDLWIWPVKRLGEEIEF